MRFRGLKLASVGTVLLLAVIAVVALLRLPPGTALPTHWNAAGEVDGRMGAGAALSIGIGVTALLSIVFAVVPSIEPDRVRRDAGAPVLRVVWAGMLVLMTLIQLLVAAPAFGWHPSSMLPIAAVGLLFIVVGNVLPKSRPGFFVGIRTPWTLTDPENWIATHRLGARTMIAGGAMILGAALLPMGPDTRTALIVAAVFIAVLPPIAYSYWFWQRHMRA